MLKTTGGNAEPVHSFGQKTNKHNPQPTHPTHKKHKYINDRQLNLLATLFLVVADKIKVNNQKLWLGRFRLDIREKFFTRTSYSTGTSYPKRLWNLSRFSRISQTKSWLTWSVLVMILL